MAGKAPHHPMTLPPTNESCDQFLFFSCCAIVTPLASHVSKEDLGSHLASNWPNTLDWEILDFVKGKLLIKFPTQHVRDDALKSFGSSLVSLPASFMSWSPHSTSVFTLRDEDFWIRLEGIPLHLWNVDNFHRMLGDLADFLEVDMSLENVKHLGFARFRIRLRSDKNLLDTKYFSFLQ